MLDHPYIKDQPTHPDYARIVAVKKMMDQGNSEDPTDPHFREVFLNSVDEHSITYEANTLIQAVMKTHAPKTLDDLFVFLISIYTEAFVAGVHFQKAGGHQEPPEETP